MTTKLEEQTRFAEFDDATHPFKKWWDARGQYMMSGGGRRESIWAARGWIAREQLAEGVEVTGESVNETVPATPAPSQPAGAREFVHSIEYDSPWWDAKMSLIGKMPSRVFDDVCALMDAYARQQTAAKDADEPTPQEIIAAYDRAIKDKEAAERERDSLRAENEALRKDRSETREMVWRLLHNIDEVAAQRDAALKAGKDER